MALQPCHECGASVSTEAVACPACGAPPKLPGVAANPGRLWRIAGWTLGLGLAGVTLLGLATLPNPNRPEAHSTEDTRPATADKPAPNYSKIVSNFYVYPIKPNLGQRQQGMTSAMLQPILVRYDGDDGANVHFMILAPNGLGVSYECARPFVRCDMSTAPGWTSVAQGTILEAVLQDAENGHLRFIAPPPMPIVPPRARASATGG